MEAPIKRTQDDWDRFFYGMAELSASMSKDPDRKVGAVLVTPDRRCTEADGLDFGMGLEE